MKRSGFVRMLLVLVVATALCPTVFAQTVQNPNRHAVSGLPALRRLYDLASTRRIDFGLIGDSNSRISSVYGHENAMGRELSSRFGVYASRVDPCNPRDAWGAYTAGIAGWGCSPFGGPGVDGVESLSYPFHLSCFPGRYLPLQDGVVANHFYNCGIQITQGSPLNVNLALRYHLTHYITESSSGGYLHLSAREGYPGNYLNTYGTSGTIATSGTAAGLSDVFFDVPAGGRAASGILFCPVDASTGSGARGPAMLLWHRVEVPSMTSGIAYSPMWEQGGKSARYTLETFKMPGIQVPMQEWFRQMTRLQNGPGVLVVHLMHGGNDTNDYNPSLGPVGGIVSSTGPGYQDNILGIIQTTRTWWTGAGYDSSNLFFIVGPYHPLPDLQGDLQLEYEQVGRDIASVDPQVIAIAGNLLSTPEEFFNNGYLLSGTDTAHLTGTGYQVWATTTLAALDAALCPGDFNNSRVVDVQDIFDFLNAWFDQNPRGDFDYSQQIDVQDIFDFLNAWFAGCV